MPSKLSLFLAELTRRKVYRIATVYVGVGVTISLGVPELFSAFDLPSSANRPVIILILVGFPIALILAWAYEVKPESPRPPVGHSPVLELKDRKSLLVYPFDFLSPDSADVHFSDGLTEELINHLSQNQSLPVISRISSMAVREGPPVVRDTPSGGCL